MGFAKSLGNDKGFTHTKELVALEIFIIWFVGGLPILFFLSILVFPTPNFIVPISVYVIGLVLLFWRYLIIDKQEYDKWKKKNLNSY